MNKAELILLDWRRELVTHSRALAWKITAKEEP